MNYAELVQDLQDYMVPMLGSAERTLRPHLRRFAEMACVAV